MDPMIRLDSVSFSYGRETAVEGVSCAFQPGSLTAVTGANGAGKSTLLKLMARVLRPTAGTISFAGRPMEESTPREYARNVGYLPQAIEPLFSMRAIDVVVSGRAPFLGRFAWESSEDFEAAQAALARCDAGYLAGRVLDEMSGGERKRVFLARALVGRPRLLLLDEPLAALDLSHVQSFLSLLRELVDREGLTVVFVSHDLNFAASVADTMLVMNRGRLALQGSPAEVMTENVLAEHFGFAASVIEAGGGVWAVPAGRGHKP